MAGLLDLGDFGALQSRAGVPRFTQSLVRQTPNSCGPGFLGRPQVWQDLSQTLLWMIGVSPPTCFAPLVVTQSPVSTPFPETRRFSRRLAHSGVMGEWEGWSKCSATCGVGQQKRERKVLQISQAGGRVSRGATTATSGEVEALILVGWNPQTLNL